MSFDSLKSRQFLNLSSGLFCQLITALYGLVLPSLIIKTYGSVLNGLVSTINQMMAYLSLVEGGLSAAALVSLYKPMAKRDYLTASSILSAVNKFYIRVAYIFLLGSVGCGIAATFIVRDNIPVMTVWLLVFSVSGSSFIAYRFLNKYKVLLQADNSIYIVNYVHALGVFIQFIFALVFVNNKLNIASISAIVIGTNIVEWIILLNYTKKIFPKIKFSVIPYNNAIKQRKDIIVHQVLSLILNNTDVILLATFSTSLGIVSVYTVYAMVGILLQRILNSFISMFSSKMGQLYAVKNYGGVKLLLKKYEVMYDIVLFSLYICMAIMILPFVSLYTKGVNDVNYIDSTIGLLFSIYGITRMLRLPYSELICCAGHYKETRIQAILEASINLVLSIILLPFMGISGVLVGSIAGEIYRTIHTYYYCQKSLLDINWQRSVSLFFINSIVFCVLVQMFTDVRYKVLDTYMEFICTSVIVFMGVLCCVFLINYITIKIYYKRR